jgi:hypothetical protein
MRKRKKREEIGGTIAFWKGDVGFCGEMGFKTKPF